MEFDGEKFGNGKLSLVYKGNKEFATKNSDLVTPTGIEPVFPP